MFHVCKIEYNSSVLFHERQCSIVFSAWWGGSIGGGGGGGLQRIKRFLCVSACV
jgi:hypothetical protein